MQKKHRPVMREESLSMLNIRPGGLYVDSTLGDGGHAEIMLKKSSPDGMVIGIDRDPEAVARASERLSPFRNRVRVMQGNFRDLCRLIREAGFDSVDGVLMDLGVSMIQVATPLRGFSFMLDGPLDMRMNPEEPVPTAYDLVNGAGIDELRKILVEYGEEKRWRPVAGAILKAREKGPIRTTRELAGLIEKALPGARRYRIHPATRTFQALRIAVNDELNALRKGIEAAVKILKSGGRLCVISFHSLEDRIVKQFFRELEKGCTCPPDMPVCACGKLPVLRRMTKKPLFPSPQEVKGNPWARSARLRAAEKIEGQP
ncbi:MAG: 16S rRNA (cytosine(1402)-N(4))-methyltransferase [Nitrospirae bacterium CG_4_9_14_3_um_filter_53_35]|nr:MAG: 16S rRNA (cytosine(1402)-N(4))-methyltransferase [Nitrospirae bacterium CG2_30_53_67]PIS37089.1 MAG: 16S rRNA (cytosine(1402)-N(4))-methyltransferase [Nitrospirae bacterium CG08_land_8_20_14_0_20_52_24]PIW84273.1 MAG: 16S rRNA (cytosine(1402)-N(4))-methyltransferase [Nitrospirae bacterium CG_4_8_14_3_um_filter_50_41]PIX85065.1 MAG: 16S rRNA (cytosine(1402)-N(4))-methyltransferase [Nitrospirae bacterium CG_4_10_14_3_um_filter_53_41]PJA76591.1 MAG: 16S rRNA (cytosine(1402)-N(4))-methyltra